MPLTPQEQAIIGLLRTDPLLDAAALAGRLGSTKAAMSVALSNLTRKGAILGRGYLVRPEAGVVVVGGAVMDVKARSGAQLDPATSNPGQVSSSPGGVGRNIAENLARLGSPTHLITALGDDSFGTQLLTHTREAGVQLDNVIVGHHPTGTYLAVLDHLGDLSVAVSDMSATDALSVADLDGLRPLLAHADVLMVDGNIPAEVTAWLLDIAAGAGVPVVLEPVSIAKAARLRTALNPQRPVLAITPNLDELGALVGRLVTNSIPAISVAARELHAVGVEHVWVRRGARGSVLSSRAATEDASVTSNELIATDVVDVTGAGDSMTAGFVHSWLRDGDAVHAMGFGQAVASLTAESAHTVRPDLTEALVLERLITQRKKQS